ncbi:hypothetical protein COCMIDRAFT_80086, partial [Bipolaris oryzae ATCC 44560]
PLTSPVTSPSVSITQFSASCASCHSFALRLHSGADPLLLTANHSHHLHSSTPYNLDKQI